ncbi:MAG: CoA transferase [bacterium]|nr:CoA transferase [bacterium]
MRSVHPEGKTTARGPLEEICVLDLSRVLAGPYCTMILGDLGAEVIKVERPGEGDDSRQWGPPFPAGESAYYLCANRNKRSVTVDMKVPAGRDLIIELAKKSDICIENFRVGALRTMGLGYEDIRKINERIIYCSITGFGQNGPYKDLPGYDFIGQAMSGIMSITGEKDGDPMKVGVAIVDITTGYYATIAILAALQERERSGKGQYLDLSLMDSAVSWLANVGSSYLVSGDLPGRYGNAHATVVPYQVSRTGDIKIAVGVGNDGQFRKLCSILGRSDLPEDPRFGKNGDRTIHREELIPLLEGELVKREGTFWIAELWKAGIPAGPINTLDKVFADPQIAAREMVVEMAHPTIGALKLVGSPMKFSRTPVRYKYPPPLMGEHTGAVLKELLGKEETEIRRLEKEGVIGAPPRTDG